MPSNAIPFEHETMFTDLGCAEDNARQYAALTNYPDGFFDVRSADGDNRGFGFFCLKCKLLYPAWAPEAVTHCGKVTRRPNLPDGLIKWLRFFFKLEKVTLQRKRSF